MTIRPKRKDSSATVTSAEFAAFWAAFPRHVGKLAAQKAYTKARTLASAEEILAGVARYKAMKPTYADWCHPSTFLNQGRWLDEADPATEITARPPWQCPHEPPCSNREMCRIATELGRPVKS